MTAGVSVVIPSLNEERWVERSIVSAFAAGASEVVVADGGSSDDTIRVARSAGAGVVDTERMRACQMNAGFDATSGEVVCFLHADTFLPPGACQAMLRSVERGAEFGGFLLRFSERDARLAFAAFMINLRTRLTRAPWGDQAHFFRRDAFLSAGRYAAIPIMEDYEMARRMKRRRRPDVVSMTVTTSGRRFLELGLVATAITNWRIVLAWHMGVAPEELRRLYGAR
jgi:rSAM/selenodomain-associated transferase 2